MPKSNRRKLSPEKVTEMQNYKKNPKPSQHFTQGPRNLVRQVKRRFELIYTDLTHKFFKNDPKRLKEVSLPYRQDGNLWKSKSYPYASKRQAHYKDTGRNMVHFIPGKAHHQRHLAQQEAVS